MTQVKLKLKSKYPVAGIIREAGETLIEGTSPIENLTAEKLLNAIYNHVVVVEVTDDASEAKQSLNSSPLRGEDKGEGEILTNETATDRHGLGAMSGSRPRRNSKHASR